MPKLPLFNSGNPEHGEEISAMFGEGRKPSWYVQAGYTSRPNSNRNSGNSDNAFLHVERRIPVGEALDTKTKVIGYYELLFNQDNGEVMLAKYSGTDEDAEIVYSEILEVIS